jgi:hypothetical protein
MLPEDFGNLWIQDVELFELVTSAELKPRTESDKDNLKSVWQSEQCQVESKIGKETEMDDLN